MSSLVRAAVPHDIEPMRTIGYTAGRRFAAASDPRVAGRADDDPFSHDELRAWIDAGRAWVVCDGAPVGFVVVDIVDGNAHIEEISVHPDHEGRGHGTALLDVVTEWARSNGSRGVTLTTFDQVEWNRPYYERRGFVVVAGDAVGPELAGRVVAEDRAGLPTEIRVCMSRPV